MDPYLLAGLVCLIVGLMLWIACWALDLFHSADEQHEQHRRSYQSAIFRCITFMVDHPEWDGEWELHALLYEYRNG